MASSLSDILSTIQSGVIALNNLGTSILNRFVTIETRLGQFILVTDYGAIGDGVTNDTAAIVAADAAAASAGTALYFPGGIYLVSSALTPSASSHWIGSGIYNTTLKTSSATANILTISNAQVTIENFGFAASVVRTGGWYVDIGASVFHLRQFLMSAPFEGIRVQDAIAIVSVEDGIINDTVAATGVSVRIGSGTGTGCIAVELRNVIESAAAGARPFSHMVIVNTGDVTLVDCQLLQGISGIYISPGNGQTVASFHMLGGFSDSSGSSAVQVVPSGTGFFARSSFDGVWLSGSVAQNVLIAPGGTSTVDGISFNDCEVYSGTDGYSITQGAGTAVNNITILGGRIAGASGSGININGLTSGIISNAIIGAAGGFGVNATGITLAGTITRLNINNNDLTGSTVKITNTMVSALSRIESNLGYNPVGNSVQTVGASPWTYTATPQRETAYVFGGTISAISINGTLLFNAAASPWVIPLEPNDTMAITYTVVPVVNVQRH